MRARVVASAGLAALLALALAGCNFLTPQATLKPYDASDGVSGRTGDVAILNALVLSDDGVSGNLVFSALNSSKKDVALTVQYASGGEPTDLELDVPAGATANFGFGDYGQVFLADIGTEPGAVMPIYFQYGDAEGKQLNVPVLNGTLAQYSELLPQTPTPTPTATDTATPTPTPTP